MRPPFAKTVLGRVAPSLQEALLGLSRGEEGRRFGPRALRLLQGLESLQGGAEGLVPPVWELSIGDVLALDPDLHESLEPSAEERLFRLLQEIEDGMRGPTP